MPPLDRPLAAVAEPKPRRERNAALTRERLLDAGLREFARVGFAGARLREIADAAGVQPALIHHYFTDKHGLYRAVLDRGLVETSEVSWSVLASARTMPELIAGFVSTLVDFFAGSPSFIAILRHESLLGSSVMVDALRERTTPILDAVLAAVRARQDAGEVRRDVAARELILASFSMIAHPFADAPIVEALLPGVAITDAAALAARKHALSTLILAMLRPAPL